jgi:hypothetical protein
MAEAEGITLVDISDVEVVSVSEWVIRCRIGTAEVAIPRAQIYEPIDIRPGPATVRVPLWFARLKGLLR